MCNVHEIKADGCHISRRRGEQKYALVSKPVVLLLRRLGKFGVLVLTIFLLRVSDRKTEIIARRPSYDRPENFCLEAVPLPLPLPVRKRTLDNMGFMVIRNPDKIWVFGLIGLVKIRTKLDLKDASLDANPDKSLLKKKI